MCGPHVEYQHAVESMFRFWVDLFSAPAVSMLFWAPWEETKRSQEEAQQCNNRQHPPQGAVVLLSVRFRVAVKKFLLFFFYRFECRFVSQSQCPGVVCIET